MPTCRACGRVGQNPCAKCAELEPVPKPDLSVLSIVQAKMADAKKARAAKVARSMRPKAEYAAAIVSAAAVRKRPPNTRAAKSPPQRAAASHEIGDLQQHYGDLLIIEETGYRGEPLDPAARDRKLAIKAARERHAAELQALREGVKSTVQAEAYWRKSGIRPGHFSQVGIAHPPTACEATQTASPKRVPTTSTASGASPKEVLRSAEERRAAFKSAAAPGNAAARQRTAASMVREQRRAAHARRSDGGGSVKGSLSEGTQTGNIGADEAGSEPDSDEDPEERAAKEAKRAAEIAEAAGQARLARTLQKAEALRIERGAPGAPPRSAKSWQQSHPYASVPSSAPAPSCAGDGELTMGSRRVAPRPPQSWEVTAGVSGYRNVLARARMLKERLKEQQDCYKDRERRSAAARSSAAPEPGPGAMAQGASQDTSAPADDGTADAVSGIQVELGRGHDGGVGSRKMGHDGESDYESDGQVEKSASPSTAPVAAIAEVTDRACCGCSSGSSFSSTAQAHRQAAAHWAARAAQHGPARYWCDQQQAVAAASHPPRHPSRVPRGQHAAPDLASAAANNFTQYPYVHSRYAKPTAVPSGSSFAALQGLHSLHGAGPSYPNSLSSSRPGSSLSMDSHDEAAGREARQHAAACAAAATAAAAAAVQASASSGHLGGGTSSGSDDGLSATRPVQKTPATGFRTARHGRPASHAPNAHAPATPWTAAAAAGDEDFEDPSTVVMPTYPRDRDTNHPLPARTAHRPSHVGGAYGTAGGYDLAGQHTHEMAAQHVQNLHMPDMATGDGLEGLLDDWLHRARVRAYASAAPVFEDQWWPSSQPPLASGAITRGLEQILAG